MHYIGAVLPQSATIQDVLKISDLRKEQVVAQFNSCSTLYVPPLTHSNKFSGNMVKQLFGQEVTEVSSALCPTPKWAAMAHIGDVLEYGPREKAAVDALAQHTIPADYRVLGGSPAFQQFMIDLALRPTVQAKYKENPHALVDATKGLTAVERAALLLRQPGAIFGVMKLRVGDITAASASVKGNPVVPSPTSLDHVAFTAPTPASLDHVSFSAPKPASLDHVAFTAATPATLDHVAFTAPTPASLDHVAFTAPTPASLDHVAFTAPTSASLDHVAFAAPTPASLDHVAFTAPTPASLDHVSFAAPTPASLDHVAFAAPTPASLDHVSFASPTPASLDHVAFEAPVPASLDHVAFTAPTPASLDHVAFTAPVPASLDHVAVVPCN